MEQPQTQSRDVARFQASLQQGRSRERAYVALLGLDVFEAPALIKLVQKGFPWKALQRFVRNTGLSTEQVADLISIPRRTLARRKAVGRLQLDESDRLLRAAYIYSRALTLFDGDREAATEWLTDNNIALGNVPPLEFAKTEIGAKEVDHLISRIEHGIFS